MPACAKSRKTNNAKSRKWWETSIWAFFGTISRSNISKLQIFQKNRFQSNWRSHLVLTSGQKPKKLLEPFLRKIAVFDFGLIWRLFANISKSSFFFFWKIQHSDFSTFIVPTLISCKKSEKPLEPFLRKPCCQPNDQQTSYYQ